MRAGQLLADAESCVHRDPVMGHLKKIASSMNIMVICTIHQPSTTVFNSFDATMVLSDGRVCYAGPAQDSIQYFEDIGRPMPAHMNPAEYMLDIVNRDFTDPAEVDALIEEWANRGLIIHPPQLLPEPRSFEGVSLWRQSMTQLRRQTILSIRDPTIYFGRAIMFLFSTVFFAVVYIKCRDRTQDQVMSVMPPSHQAGPRLPHIFPILLTIVSVPSCIPSFLHSLRTPFPSFSLFIPSFPSFTPPPVPGHRPHVPPPLVHRRASYDGSR